MLTSDSIVIAVFAVMMARHLSCLAWTILSLGLEAVLFSAFCLRSVLWVHWSTTEELTNAHSYEINLLRLRNKRTMRCRLVFYRTSASFVLLVLLLILMIAP